MTTYFGFAVADSMFPETCTATRRPLTIEQVRELLQQPYESCCNPSHEATIRACQARFGFAPKIPDKPPRVVLQPGDRVVVMSVRGLPRLTDRREYTDEEIQQATFSFGLWTVE